VPTDSHAIYSAGHLLYLVDEALVAHPFDPARLELTGEPFRVAEGVAELSETSRGVFSASEGGTLVYQPAVRDPTMEIVWVDRRGDTLKRIGELPGAFDFLALAPDGNTAALTVSGAEGREQDIWLLDAETGQRTRFTFGANAYSPVWSPDGASLAFVATVDGTTGLHRKLLRGSSMTRLDAHRSLPFSWSPDGRFIAEIFAGEETGADIWILPVSGEGEPYPYTSTKSLEVNPAFSPDGRWIAYASDETGSFEIYVGSFEEPERRWQVSTKGGQSPRWRADGKEIFYVEPGGLLTATRLDTDGAVVRPGSSEELFEMATYWQSTWQGYGVSPDGSRFLIQKPVSGEDPSTNSLVLVTDWRAARSR